MLFTNDPDLGPKAAQAGVDRLVVDIERRGKKARQSGWHLECNRHQIRDLEAFRELQAVSILRVNSLHPKTSAEIDLGLKCGAGGFILPMVRYPEEVVSFVNLIDGRALAIALVETLTGLINLMDISRIKGLDEVYIGLNDLALEAKWPFGWRLLSEGILDFFVKKCAVPFGLGGATVLDCGKPLSTDAIMGELARLGASSVIIRRAFRRDVKHLDMKEEVSRMKMLFENKCARSPEQTEIERAKTWSQIEDTVYARRYR